MPTIRVDLTNQLAQLQNLSNALGLSVEDLARLGIQQTLLTGDKAFLEAAREVLANNEQLYPPPRVMRRPLY